MQYEAWREEVFGTTDDFEPHCDDLSQEFYQTDLSEHFNYIDRALIDSEVHKRYSVSQIGNGLEIVFNNGASDLPFCYVNTEDVGRIKKGVDALRHLYCNYFDQYCTLPVQSIGNNVLTNEYEAITHVCYMFWDVFILNPQEAQAPIIEAALDVMHYGLSSKNDQSIVSALHGLGHWALDAPRAVDIIDEWLRQPTTENTIVYEYAMQAKTGYVQ